MVAIVSGSSLGLDLTSWRTLGERVANGPATQGRGNETVAVNLATGNLVLQSMDQTLVGRGPDAQSLRTYNSQGLRDDDNGDNWRQSVAPYPLQLVGTWGASGSTVRRTAVDGSVAIHRWSASSGTYVCTDGDGAHDTVRKLTDGRLEWRDGSSGLTQVYAGTADGRLLESRDTSGNVLTFTYDTQGRLDRMTTPTGDALAYAWSGNNLSSVSTLRSDGTAADITRYTYDDRNRLTSVVVDLSPGDGSVADGNVYATTYAYDQAGRVASLVQSDGTTLTIDYVSLGGRDRVASIRDALGQITSFSYALSDGVAGYSTVTDPTGLVTRYDVDAKGQLTAIKPPAVNGRIPATSFTWDADGNLLTRTDGEGRVTTCEYDSSGNQRLVRDRLGNTVTRTFNAQNQVLSETRYLTPDPDGAGALQPGSPLTRWFVYDDTTGTRLLFAVEPDGSVTEDRYNELGERITTLQYTGRTAVPTALPTRAQMDAWAAAQTMSSVLRTDYSYDARSQLARSVLWARLGSDGLGIADGSESVQRYVRDAAGRLLQIVDSGGGTTSLTYDGLGRELTRTDALGTLTVTEYADAVRTTRTRLSSGLVTTSVWDAAGRLVSTTDSSATGMALGETRYVYDAAGRLRMTQDPVGARRWLFWDVAGRQVAEIDARGGCTFYTYDASDRVIEVRRSAASANLAALVDGTGQPLLDVTLASVAPAANAADMRELRAYDAAGRLWRTARALGSGTAFAVTEQTYDGLGRVVATLGYASTVSIAAGVTTIPTPAANGADRLTRQFWDGAGRLIGRLDAEGALVTWSWDAAGRCQEERAWATATATTSRATGTLSQLQPAESAQDQRTLRWYDSGGRVLAELDAEGYLTETVYDAAGRVTQSVRYATPSPATNVTAATPRTQLRPATSAQDRTTSRTWDSLGRLLSETLDGVTTTWLYDTQGRVTSTIRAAGTQEARSLLARYDLQGRLIGELAGEGAAQLTGTQTQDQVDAIWARWGVSHTYDAAGRRLSSTDAAGGTRWFFYDAAGALTHVVNALGEVTGNRYDSLGRLIERQIWDLRVSTTGLVGGPAPAALLSALGTATVLERFTYTRDGEVLTQTDANGVMVTRERNAFSEVTRQTTPGPSGQIVSVASTRDRMGRIVAQATGASGATPLAIRTTEYDVFGRVTRLVDPVGMETTQTWDRLGRLVQVRSPDQGLRSAAYDAFGLEVLVTDAMGAVTRMAWDRATRTLTVTTPEGLVTTSTRDRLGQLIRLTDATGQITSWRYDRNGRLLQKDGPDGSSTRSTYDEGGHEVTRIDANGVRTDSTFDAVGRVLTSTLDPGGLALQTAWTWDARGRKITQLDASGLITTWSYDGRNRVLRQAVDPGSLNLLTTWTYDSEGRVLTVRDPAGVTTTTSFDLLGRRVRQQVGPAALGLVTIWAWDAAGNLLSSTDAVGATTRYVNDSAGRPVFTINALGQVRQTVRDAAGRIVRSVAYAQPIDLSLLPSAAALTDVQALLRSQPSLDEVEHRVLDSDGRLVATVDGTGAVVAYTLDAVGRVVTRTAYAKRIDLTIWTAGTVPTPAADPDHDETLSSVYDAAGRVLYTLDGTGALVFSRWDKAGNLLQRTSYASPIATGTVLKESALAAAAKTVADTARDASERHVYDAAGRRIWSVDGTGAVTRRTFDAAGRVIRQVRYAAPIDPAGDPASVATGTSDAVSVNAYDLAGRLVFAVDPAGAVTEFTNNAVGLITRRRSWALPALSVLTMPSPSVSAVRAVLVTSGDDRMQWQAYDDAGRPVYAVDGNGAVTEFVLDGLGREVQRNARAKTISIGSLGVAPTVSLLRGLVQTDSRDRVSRRFLDASGRLAAELDAAGSAKTYGYDGIGRLVSTTTWATPVTEATVQTLDQLQKLLKPVAEDRTETRAWNGAGQLVRLTDALGQSEQYTRDAIGRLVSFRNKLGATWTYEVDAAGRQISETTPTVRITRAMADGRGALTSDTGTDAAIVTRQAWDALGRLVRRVEAAGTVQERTTSYAYDAAGHQVRVIFPTAMVYDAAGDAAASNGFGAEATRVETARSLETRTYYDAFGNAVASIDVGGAISRKAYDAQGRVVYDVDPLGRITRYTRNAFGDVTALTRFGQAQTSLVSTQLDAGNAVMLRTSIATRLAASDVNHSADRTILTTYDRMGRVTRVEEPRATVEIDTGTTTAARTTVTRYDAFGQIITVGRLNSTTDPTALLLTTRYWDAAGRERATIDAAGYLTLRSFDAVGNLTETTEFANALTAGSWTESDFRLPVGSSEDRVTRQTWDALSRRTSETRLGIEFSSDADGSRQRGDAVTRWTYDALGNTTSTTDAEGGVTWTAYDALGRIRAVAAPERTLADGSKVAPITSFLRDAYGQVTVRREHSVAGRADGAGIVPPASAAGDRVTRFGLDLQGHEVQSTDAAGNSVFKSYDAWGHLAKQWQPVVDVDGRIRTLFQRDEYDKAGQLVVTRTPGLDISGSTAPTEVVTRTDWNAFGEMTRRQTDAADAETFEWDNAGRIWRTNSGDGVTRVQLYDLQGNVSSELRSTGSAGTNVSLANFSSAAEVARASGVRRTSFTRDALGRVVSQTQPERALAQGSVAVRTVSARVEITSSAQAVWSLDNGMSQFGGVNCLTVTWDNLAQLGPGDVRVDVDYMTVRTQEVGTERVQGDGEFRTRSSRFDLATSSSQGLTMSWEEPPAFAGGVGRILRLRIYKCDLAGQERVVYDSATAAGRMAVEVSTPANAKESCLLEFRPAGSPGDSGWTTIDPVWLVDFGDVLRFEPGSLGAGNWEYRASVRQLDGSLRALGGGTMTISQDVLGAISADLGVNRMGTDIGVLSWSRPGQSVGQTFRYRLAGSSDAWSTLPVRCWELANRDGVDLRTLGTGTYTYELLWGDAGSAQARNHVSGTFQISGGVASTYVPPSGTPPFNVGLSLGPALVNGQQVNALNIATTVPPEVLFRPAGGVWTALRVVNDTLFNGGDNVMDKVQALLPSGLAPGSYEIRVRTDEPSEATARYTVLAEVPGYTSPPTLELTTQPYVPEYWTDPIPATYSVSGVGSVGASISGASVTAVAIAASTAGTQSARPIVQQVLDRWGNVLSISDARSSGWTTRYRYNAANQMISASLPDSEGAQSTTSPVRGWYFDRLGRQVATRDTRGNVNGQRWNAAGQLVEERHADTGVIRHAYDVLGNRVRTIDAEGWRTDNVYDVLGRKRAVLNQGMSKTSALSTTWSWTYDAAGRMLTQTNGAGETQRYVWDLRGNLAQTRLPLGQITQTLWDAFGRKARETDANGYVATWTYNAFGRLREHRDLEGKNTTYSYDQAGQLTTQRSERGQLVYFNYDTAGQLIGIDDRADNKQTSYQYDLSGRRIRERTVQNGVIYQDNHLAWDSRGLLRSVADSRALVTMDYDTEGNRTHVYTRVAYQGVDDRVVTESHRWNTYDVMNRQFYVDAITQSGDLGEQFHKLTYDLNGNRKTDQSWGNHVLSNQQRVIVGWDENATPTYTNLPVTYTTTKGWVVEGYAYDGQNRLISVTRDGVQIDRRLYDGAGRLVQQGAEGQPQPYLEAINAGLPPNQTNGLEMRYFSYDANGRLLMQNVRWAGGNWRTDTVWDPAIAASLGLTPQGTIGYDAAGNARGYIVRYYGDASTPAHVDTFTQGFGRREGYVQTGTAARSTWSQPGQTTQTYDPNGYLVGFTDSAQANNNRTFVNDAEGRILWVNQAGRIQRQLVANGETLGTYGVSVDPGNPSSGSDRAPRFVNGQDFGFGYARISASYPSPSPGNYTVRSGDTLQTIARGAYGDSRQWFRIAEANGLSGPADLKVGQTLRIPSLPGGASNDATTFRTYDPSRMTGDLSPTLLAPLPGGCGSTGKLLMVVVAVAVFVMTAQAEFISSFWSTLLGSPASGIAVKAAVAATAAVASNVASQVVGLATGDVQRFDWRSVAISAVGGAMSGGLQAGMFGSAFAGTELPNAIARAALTNAMTQGVAVITGAQQRFDWRGVAAAAVATGITNGLGGRSDGSSGVEGAVKVTAVGLIAGLAAAAVRGGRVSMQQVGVDAFGNAVGSDLAEVTNGFSYSAEAMVGDYVRENNRFAGATERNASAGVGDSADREISSPSYGRTFAEETALRRVLNDPDGYLIGRMSMLRFDMREGMPFTAEAAQSRWDQTGRRPSFDVGDPMGPEGSDGDMLAAAPRSGRVRGPIQPSLNRTAVDRLDSLSNATDLLGLGDVYRDIKQLAPQMAENARQDTLQKIQATLRERLGMRAFPSPESLGATRGIYSDGSQRFDVVDLLDRYGDALRKVGLAQSGAIEIDYHTFEIKTIGNQRLTPTQYSKEIEMRYQKAFARGVELGEQAYAAGRLRYPLDMPKQLQVGLFADNVGREALLRYNLALGVPEGPGQLISLNRWAYDMNGTGNYVRPDVLLDFGPGRRAWLDGKTSLLDTAAMTKQFENFYRYTDAAWGKVVTPQGTFPVPRVKNGR